MEVLREIVHGNRYDVVGNHVFEVLEPEGRHLREDFSLIGNRRGENNVERGQAVRGVRAAGPSPAGAAVEYLPK